jgi:hypothetical protein
MRSVTKVVTIRVLIAYPYLKTPNHGQWSRRSDWQAGIDGKQHEIMMERKARNDL